MYDIALFTGSDSGFDFGLDWIKRRRGDAAGIRIESGWDVDEILDV